MPEHVKVEHDAVELDTDADADLDAVLAEAVAAVEKVEERAANAEIESAFVVEPDEGEDDELARVRRELDELRNRSVRTLADFDNYRKRSERERADARRYAATEVLQEMVAVVDNLERALGAEGSAADLKTGVEMILRQMQELMRRQGVREVPVDGVPFDPAMHEAVSRREQEGLEEPRVARTFQRGYILHDRLLRPAVVEVAVPPDGGGGAN